MKQSQSPSVLSTAQSKAKAILIGQANRRADVAVKLRQLADKRDSGFSPDALKRLAVLLQSGLAQLVGELYFDTSGNAVDCVRYLDPAGREILDYMGATSRLLQEKKMPADFADRLRKLADGIEGGGVTRGIALAVINQAGTASVRPKGNWLIPTALADIANRLGNVGPKKIKTMLKQYGLKNAGNRQTWTVRLDKMPANMRTRLEK